MDYGHYLVFRTDGRDQHLLWDEKDDGAWPDTPHPRVRLEWPAPDEHFPPQRFVLTLKPDTHGCPVYELHHPYLHDPWSDAGAPILSRPPA